MKPIACFAVAVTLLLGAALGAQPKPVAYVAYLGVTTAPVGETLAAHLKLPPGVGLLVEYVDPNSPAAKVLARNDVLHKLGDQLLVNHEQLRTLLRAYKPGDTVTLTVIRNGESREVKVQLAERP
ncbi:MAG: PDZ domain-containing protein, partial [Verrucomicrobiae bacterium]|nr:PDZ domain-containing protein [Verrucomicrobiae bacterium]